MQETGNNFEVEDEDKQPIVSYEDEHEAFAATQTFHFLQQKAKKT